MNATCPRCGTVSLVGAQATRFICKTCHLRFCADCRHWKLDRKQPYCASCGAAFNDPPLVMPWRLAAAVLYIPALVVLGVAPFIRPQFWQVALIIILIPLLYTSAYLGLFYRRTGLTQATRREAILLVRRTLTLATVAYIATMLDNHMTLVVGVIITVALVLAGIAVRRTDAEVIQELQANRHVWETVLAMSNRDVLLMRFPNVRRQAKT